MNQRINQILDRFKIKKPFALQWHEWDDWETEMRATRPVAFWLNETLPDSFKYVYKKITKPYNDLRYWIRVRIFDRYHVIYTGLKPGYADGDTRILHGMFNLLVDFVEVEKAWMYVVFDKEAQKKHKHPWWSLGWTRFKAFRDPEAGLEHLRWEMTLDDPSLPAHERSTSQAHTAKEVYEIYDWWKNIRPWRPEPHDASGWSDYCDQRRTDGRHVLDFRHETEEDAQLSRDILALNRTIEEQQEQEDQDMLIRLIKIRRSLWT